MSKKYGIYCESCNVLLNNDDDIFGTKCGQLYHSTCIDISHGGESTDCQSQMLFKMNLKFANTPTITTEAEGECGILELKETNNAARQYVQQLEARIKTLEDALLQAKSNGNKLTDCVDTLEKNKAIDKAPDDVNNITQDPKASKETHNESDLSGEQHNDTENVASANDKHHTRTISDEKQEVVDLRRNCVFIEVDWCRDDSLELALSSVRTLANEMNAQIADNSVIHIDMDYPYWYVYFRDEDSKNEFLKNRFIFEYDPDKNDELRILDYSDCGLIDIENFPSSDLSLEAAFVNVLGLAKKMGMTNIRNFIDHIDVYYWTRPTTLTYSVRFNRQDKKNAFLENEDILKEFPETKFVGMLDVGGHTSSEYNLNYFNMAQASANVIGIAELMGLSLSTDNFKRIYVLNTKKFEDYLNHVTNSFLVEFSSSDLKNKFIKKKSELDQIIGWCSNIDISDVETEVNIVSIKYNIFHSMFTTVSFIGLAKQLGYSFTSDQTDRFVQLSNFIRKTSLTYVRNI